MGIEEATLKTQNKMDTHTIINYDDLMMSDNANTYLGSRHRLYRTMSAIRYWADKIFMRSPHDINIDHIALDLINDMFKIDEKDNKCHTPVYVFCNGKTYIIDKDNVLTVYDEIIKLPPLKNQGFIYDRLKFYLNISIKTRTIRIKYSKGSLSSLDATHELHNKNRTWTIGNLLQIHGMS